MDLSAHPDLLEALNTTAAPDKARNRVARAEESRAMPEELELPPSVDLGRRESA